MPIKYIPYFPDTVEGQAILNNFVRTRRALKYRDNDKVVENIKRGMPYYEVEKLESVGNNPRNMVIRGECISACAYLKEQGIKVDLVYIDPPFASGADYAKKIYIRKNPKVAEAIKKVEETMEIAELEAFEEKMYGDIWNKEAYLNWMYENLMAIKNVMTETGSIYVHLDWHIGHYVKILMDEIFGEDNFTNEVIWKYVKFQMRKMTRFANNTDRLLIYSINEEYTFNPQVVKLKTPKKLLKKGWDKEKGVIANIKDEFGKTQKIEVYDEKVDDLWNISFIGATSGERTDYVTQKPKALLERVIKTSSNEFRNEKTKEPIVVADFFGGSGVTAKVANDLKRNFIHVDVGLNSIQTTRDGLIQVKAEFDILEIKDGVNLFRNPVQTMDKLAQLITGLQRNPNGLSKFWFGAISDSKLGTIPVYVPDLRDHTQKVLDIPIINRIVNQELPDLENVKKVTIYYIDIDEPDEIEEFIKANNMTEIKIELLDLKQVLDETVVDDIAEYKTTEKNGTFTVEIFQFISDRLRQKIDEHNQKGMLQQLKRDSNEEDGDKGKKFTLIEISKEGLELIEFVSLDCTNKEGAWKSDKEIKIDKLGYIIEDGQKIKNFWDAKVTCTKKPLRMKLRNIAGDEIILDVMDKKKSQS